MTLGDIEWYLKTGTFRDSRRHSETIGDILCLFDVDRSRGNVGERGSGRRDQKRYRNDIQKQCRSIKISVEKKIRIGTSVERLSVKADFETNSSMQSMIFTDQFD